MLANRVLSKPCLAAGAPGAPTCHQVLPSQTGTRRSGAVTRTYTSGPVVNRSIFTAPVGTFSEVVSRPRFAFGSQSSTVASPSAPPVPTVSLYGCSSAFAAAAFSTLTGSVATDDAAGPPASGSSPVATNAHTPAATATARTTPAAISLGFCTVISPERHAVSRSPIDAHRGAVRPD